MKNSLKMSAFVGAIALSLVVAFLALAPVASAQWNGGYGNRGGYGGNYGGNGGGYGYNTGNSYSGYNYGGGYGSNYGVNVGGGYGNSYHSSNLYPPAPTYANTGAIQVVYANGYYYNYNIPTVRVAPPIQSWLGGYGGWHY